MFAKINVYFSKTTKILVLIPLTLFLLLNTGILCGLAASAVNTGILFSDDFAVNSLAGYSIANTWTQGGTGKTQYDTAGQRALVLTGDNVGIKLSHSIAPNANGSFAVDFLPIRKYPTGGIFILKLSQDANNYYEFIGTDGYAPGTLTKYVNGVAVESSKLALGYSQNSPYTVTINFSPAATSVTAFNQALVIDSNVGSILVNSFSIELQQQDAYLDNIIFSAVLLGNQPPTAVNDVQTTSLNTAVSITVLGNDTDPDNNINPATVAVVDNPFHGNTVVNGDGSITYTPDTGYIGSDSFLYTVGDSEGAISNEATVDVTVTESGILFSDDFAANSLAGYSIANTWTQGGTGKTQYDTAGQRALVLTGDNVGIKLSHSIAPNANGSFAVDFLPIRKYPTGGIFILKLSQDANNYYEFIGTDGYAPGTLTKYVNGVAVESSKLALGYSQNSPYTVTINFSPAATSVTAFNQALVIDSNVGSILVNSFSIELQQQDAYLDNIIFSAVLLGNQPPTAVNDVQTTSLNTAVSITVLDNDTDPDNNINPATVAVVDNPFHGNTVVNGDGSITYTPDTGYIGSDSFLYTVGDSEGAISNEATVDVTVTESGILFSDDFAANSLAGYSIANTWTQGGTGKTQYDTAGQRALVLTGDNVGIKLSHSIAPNASGSFAVDFLPIQKYPTGGTFILKLSQDANNYYEFIGTDGYAPGTLTKYVNGVAVESSKLAKGYSQNSPYTVTINFSPAATSVTAFNQALVIDSNVGSILVNSFSIELQQQDAYLDNIIFSAVLLGNQPPTAVNDVQTTSLDTAVSITVLGNDTDPDNNINPATVAVVDNPFHGNTVVNGDGSITYTPDTGYIGSDSFLYTVGDSEGAISNEATVDVTVTESGILFSDDFAANSLAGYSIANTWTQGGTGKTQYDAAGQRALVLTGDNVGIKLSHSIAPNASGSFAVDFLPIQKYPTGGTFILKLSQDANNYYEFMTTDGYAAGTLTKYINGVAVESSKLAQGYSQNIPYTVTINFSPAATSVEALSQALVIDNHAGSILVKSFSIELQQQDAYLDNIIYNDGYPYVLITSPEAYSLQTNTVLSVEAFTIHLEAGWMVKFVLDQGSGNEQTFIDNTAPYAMTFTGLSSSEHTVDCYITDPLGNMLNGEFTHDSKVNIGVGKYFVAVGDSITFGVGDNFSGDNVSMDRRQTGGGYTPILNDILTVALGTPITVVNEGIPGARTAEGVISISDTLLRHPEAQHILILYGMNDLPPDKSLKTGKGLHPGDPNYTGTYKDFLQQIINQIKNAGKTASLSKVPIALGDGTTTGIYTDPVSGQRNVLIREYNEVIDELVADPANKISTTPPDFYSYFLNNYHSEYYDNIHPNGIGYQSMAELWGQALAAGGL